MLSLANKDTVPQVTIFSLYVTVPETVPRAGPQPTTTQLTKTMPQRNALWDLDIGLLEIDRFAAVHARQLGQQVDARVIREKSHGTIRHHPIAAARVQAPIVHGGAGVHEIIGLKVARAGARRAARRSDDG